MILTLALSLLSLTLMLIIIRLERELARARNQAQRERMLACIFQLIAKDAKQDAQMWRYRAQHPGLEPWWEVIEHALEEEL